MEKKSIQGKAESKRWKREATLRDILDALNEIKESDKSPEEKAQLRQRVIDFGQFLAKEIHEGRRSVPESDDNKTIKEFNLRMLQSYYMDRNGGLNEAKSPEGYYNQKNEFVKNNGEFANHGQRNGRNPRWYPIALKDEEKVVVVPVRPNIPDSEKPFYGGGGSATSSGAEPVRPNIPDGEKPFYGGGGSASSSEAEPIWKKVEEELFITSNSGGGASSQLKPSGAEPIWKKVEEELFITPNSGGGSGAVPSASGVEESGAESFKPTNEDKKSKKNKVLPWLMPLIPLIMANQCGEKGQEPVVDTEEPKKDEVKADVLTKQEKDYLRYTVEKGVRMVAHQLGIEDGKDIYLNFVSNADKLPDKMKDLAEKYNLHTMKDEKFGVDLENRNEILATTLLLMSETYPNIKEVILEQIKNPQKEMTDRDLERVERRLKLASLAHAKHNGNSFSNLVSDIDYGVFGADKKTGWCVDFMDEYKKLESGKTGSDKEYYGEVVKNTFKNGGNDRY